MKLHDMTWNDWVTAWMVEWMKWQARLNEWVKEWNEIDKWHEWLNICTCEFTCFRTLSLPNYLVMGLTWWYGWHDGEFMTIRNRASNQTAIRGPVPHWPGSTGHHQPTAPGPPACPTGPPAHRLTGPRAHRPRPTAHRQRPPPAKKCIYS
jgi:hypothetical protein